MKKILVLVSCFFIANSFAQNFTGKATYKTHRKVDFKISKSKNAPNSDMQKQLQEQMKKMFQKTYTLNFTKSESTYKQNQKLAAPQPNKSGVIIKISGMGGGTDVLYKNISEKRFVNKTEIMGKRFLIKDKIKNIEWELTSETKNIGIYTCYKAIFSIEEEYIKHDFKDDKQTSKKATKTVKTIAWYTPQIPVSNGPSKFGGLPGLILEINEGKLTIVCTEVVLNPSNKIEVKEPTKGKKVTQKKFDKIMDKKSKEMMKRFRSRKGRGNKGGITVEFNG